MLVLNLDGKVCFVLRSEEISNEYFIDRCSTLPTYQRLVKFVKLFIFIFRTQWRTHRKVVRRMLMKYHLPVQTSSKGKTASPSQNHTQG